MLLYVKILAPLVGAGFVGLTSYLGYSILSYKSEVSYLKTRAQSLETELTQAKYNLAIQNQKLAENALAISKFNTMKGTYSQIIDNTYKGIVTEPKGCEDELDTIDKIFGLQGSYSTK